MRRSATVLLALAVTALSGAAAAAECPRPDALGTARVMPVDTSTRLEVGTKIYRSTLPLAPKEVVLTFDDGPFGATTDKILDALAAECVKATFFVVGQQAAARPAQLRRIAALGHTVAHHSHTHRVLREIPVEVAKADMEQGWRTVDRILYGADGPRPRVPFFRYPGFAQSRELTAWLVERGVGVFGTDLWGSDWTKISSDGLLRQVLARLDERGGGILLLHDIHRHTADMVAPLLREMKLRGYRVVHLVPAERAPALTTPAVPAPQPAGRPATATIAVPVPTGPSAPAPAPQKARAPLRLLGN